MRKSSVNGHWICDLKMQKSTIYQKCKIENNQHKYVKFKSMEVN